MFSFFKFLQKFFKDLKSNKGLWFTTLAVMSVAGIFICLYILTNMTESASKDVYQNISKNYTKNFKNRVLKKEENIKKIILALKSNEELITNIENNNLVAVGEEVSFFNDTFKQTGFTKTQLSFYPIINQINQYRSSVNTVINSKNRIFGIEVLLDGIFYVYIEPVIENDRLIGILELKEEVQSFKDEYLKDDVIFTFLLEERMLNKLSIQSRTDKYKELIESIYIEEAKYDGQFSAKIIESGKEEFNSMIERGYSVDDTYFRAAQKVSDINGNIIGVIVLGETVEGSGSFVNIVDDMTKTVTTVALGLVISILLFMF